MKQHGPLSCMWHLLPEMSMLGSEIYLNVGDNNKQLEGPRLGTKQGLSCTSHDRNQWMLIPYIHTCIPGVLQAFKMHVSDQTKGIIKEDVADETKESRIQRAKNGGPWGIREQLLRHAEEGKGPSLKLPKFRLDQELPYARVPALKNLGKYPPEFDRIVTRLYTHMPCDFFTRAQCRLYRETFEDEPVEVPKPDVITFLAYVPLVLRSAAEDHLAFFPNLFRAVYARAYLSGEMNHPDYKEATPSPPISHAAIMQAWATPTSELLPQDLPGWDAPSFEAAKLNTHPRFIAQGKNAHEQRAGAPLDVVAVSQAPPPGSSPNPPLPVEFERTLAGARPCNSNNVSETVAILGTLDDIYPTRARFDHAPRKDIIFELVPVSVKRPFDIVEETYNDPLEIHALKRQFESGGGRKLLVPEHAALPSLIPKERRAPSGSSTASSARSHSTDSFGISSDLIHKLVAEEVARRAQGIFDDLIARTQGLIKASDVFYTVQDYQDVSQVIMPSLKGDYFLYPENMIDGSCEEDLTSKGLIAETDERSIRRLAREQGMMDATVDEDLRTHGLVSAGNKTEIQRLAREHDALGDPINDPQKLFPLWLVCVEEIISLVTLFRDFICMKPAERDTASFRLVTEECEMR
ncbi:hypothetical protein PG985_007402 [Apiospora marii]